MTWKEYVREREPNRKSNFLECGMMGCPDDYAGSYNCPPDLMNKENATGGLCKRCWNREVPDEYFDITDKKEAITREDFTTALHKVEFIRKQNKEFLKNNPQLLEKDKELLELDNETFKSLTNEPPHISEAKNCSTPLMNIAVCAEKDRMQIKDSGNRTEFATGAVRDIQEGKGRCDLMPLDVIDRLLVYANVGDSTLKYEVFTDIHLFINSNDANFLFKALSHSCIFKDPFTMLLEVAKHFEEGAKKYGENNWQKGIPTKRYIDSAVRHYLKFLRGDKDEPHDRAFVWNILCCIWTRIHKPELNDYAKKGEEE